MPEHYKNDASFNPNYTHQDINTREIFKAPFPVGVFGIGEDTPFLGVGRVIGSIKLSFGENPVIEITDIADGELYSVLGLESWWICPIPEEIIENMSNGRLAVKSVKAYIEELRTDEKFSEILDDNWLEENGIDPT